MPLQFTYEAADCRIFLTPNTFNNFTNLWHYAADAIWTSPGLCVQGSTGFATSGSSSGHPAPSLVPLDGVTYSDIGIPTFSSAGAANIPFLMANGPLPDALASEILTSAERIDQSFTRFQSSGAYFINDVKPIKPLPVPKPSTQNLKPRRFKGGTAPPTRRRKIRR